MSALRSGLLAAAVSWLTVFASPAAEQPAGVPPVAPAAASAAAPAAAPAAGPRIEARTANLLAVGIVRGDRMTIRLSQIADNVPVHDAVVTVALRGVVHPTVAQADGGYLLQTQDLDVPGSATIEFQVRRAESVEKLTGEIDVADDGRAKPEDKNGARQLGWWVLNFAVCIGFLMLWSRRRKAAEAREKLSEN